MNIAIVYHSAGGNTKSLAEAIHSYLPDAKLYRVSEFEIDSVNKIDCLLVGTYTWGDGDLPAKMSKFYNEIEQEDLSHLTTGVFGTGETNYKWYCEGVNIFRNMLYAKSKLVATIKIEQAYQESDLERIEKFCGIIKSNIKIKGDLNK